MAFPEDPPDALEALAEECELVSSTVLELTEDVFARPTRCAAWNVKELLGHMYRDVNRTNEGLAQPPPEEITHDSVTYWRAYDRVGDATSIADRAKEVAAGYPTGRAMAEAWDEMWRGAVEAASKEDPDRSFLTWGPVLTFEEFLRTRILEVTVHRMDLEHACGRKGWGTDQAVSILDDILVGLLGAEPPPDLDWDAVDFIEVGTGRRELTDRERAILGVRRSSRFPLLG
jgi:uncharacterized protein (TIGR03083 family)